MDEREELDLTETDSDFDADIDSIWDDEEIEDEDEPETESKTEDETEDSDQSEEETEGAEDKGEDAEEKAEPEADEQKDSYTLKHLDEVKTVGREEVISLAQKGMDYDRIRQERDELRSGREEFESKKAEYEKIKKFLTDMSGGKDLDSFMEDVEVKALMARKAEQGLDISEQSAREEIRFRKEKEAFNAEKEAFAQKGKEEQKDAIPDPKAEKQQKDILDFCTNFPEVSPDDIPREVWDKVFSEGKDLSGEYALHENRVLKEKIKDLEMNLKNRERSTGSQKSTGKGKIRDIYDEVWDDD